MEMCWLYGWATFFSMAVLRKPFPFLDAATAFILAAGITHLTMGRGWRIAAVFGMQALGFACALSGTVHGAHFPAYPFLSKTWLVGLMNAHYGFLEWMGFVLTILWTFFFWIGGVALARRPVTYYAFCSRFDIGLGAFFCLFLTKLVVLVKGGVTMDDPALQLLIFPFFLFSLVAVGLTRVRGDGSKSFLPGRRAMGVILAFASTALLLTGGFTLLFMSGLSAAARTAQGAISTVAGSSFPFIERALRILFCRGGAIRSEPAVSRKAGAFDSYTWAKDS